VKKPHGPPDIMAAPLIVFEYITCIYEAMNAPHEKPLTVIESRSIDSM